MSDAEADPMEISVEPPMAEPAQLPAEETMAGKDEQSPVDDVSPPAHDPMDQSDHKDTPASPDIQTTEREEPVEEFDPNVHRQGEDEDLSPPPDTPVDNTGSRSSSFLDGGLPDDKGPEDEIVVGTKDKARAESPRVLSEAEDISMDSGNEMSVVSQQKRKRASGVYDETMDDDIAPPHEELDAPQRQVKPAKGPAGVGVKGVIIGFWRESPVPENADKHSVIGFIDVRDRLRTRIQTTTRDGRKVPDGYPIPPGPGGSWLTFDKVAFDDALIGCNHHLVKEFVRLRADTTRPDETPEEKARLDAEALTAAQERIEQQVNTDAVQTPHQSLVAYGFEVPEDAAVPQRPEAKKRKVTATSTPTAELPAPAQQSLDNLPGTRPTRILIGYWKDSSEEKVEDKHAVYGILGANDMFRVKLVRETRDGRPLDGNFPVGPGGLWILWETVVFEPHLRTLTRPEVKEYCRVRQYQIDQGEDPRDRVANEQRAIIEAQNRVLNLGAVYEKVADGSQQSAPIRAGGPSHEEAQAGTNGTAAASTSTQELRSSRRSENGVKARHSLPDVEMRPANRTPAPAALERTHTIARREIARVEAAQARADQRAASVSATSTPTPSNRSMFQENVSRLNKVWAAQEANRIKAGDEDAKIYMGVKYERKQNGPFEGKLVSQGTIISIDGEDYVEYRVLTKPTFF